MWTQVAMGVFVGMTVRSVAGRVVGAMLVVYARRSPTLLKMFERDTRADAPLREAFRRGGRP